MPTASKKLVVKRPPRTLKEKKFAKAYLETGNATESVILAGYDVKNRHVAENIASENLGKLGFDHYFREAGLTDDVMALNTARIALTSKKRDQFTGEVTTDDAMQLRGMEFAAKLQSKLIPRAAVDSEGRVVTPILGMFDVHSDDSDS